MTRSDLPSPGMRQSLSAYKDPIYHMPAGMRQSLSAYKDRRDHMLSSADESGSVFREIHDAELLIWKIIKEECDKNKVKLDFQMSSGERAAFDYMVSFLENNFDIDLIAGIIVKLEDTRNLKALEIFDLFVRSSMNDNPKKKGRGNSQSKWYLLKNLLDCRRPQSPKRCDELMTKSPQAGLS